MIVSPHDGSWAATPEIVAEIVAAVSEHRESESPFDVVITGRTGLADATETVASFAAAGATWWLEGFRPAPGEYQAALQRIEAGPPA
jgi:hypothetical protein